MSDPKLGAGIREALIAGGEVHVMVALETETNGQDASATAAIARAQDAVLSSLDSSDFRIRQRYAAVPAFSGTLRSVRGLDRLLAHPLVRRVDRDPGGTGMSARLGVLPSSLSFSEGDGVFSGRSLIPERAQTSLQHPSP